MMKVVLVEDEKPAAQTLEALLQSIDATIEVLATLYTLEEALNWLQKHTAHLIFMDVNLGSRTAFELFEHIDLQTPIIFTTAFDQYAVEAFKVNSVDYLLKTIQEEALRQSLEKYKRLYEQQAALPTFPLEQLLQSFQKTTKNYQKRFLVASGDRIKSILTEEIAYFYADQRYVVLVSVAGEQYIIDHTLEALESLLDPDLFFRVSRQYFVHFQAIKTMKKHTRGRVKLGLEPTARKEIIVSIERVQTFKDWLNR